MSSILEGIALRERFKAMPTIRLAAGETLLAAGTATGRLYLLERGSVEVVREGTTIGTVTEPGAMFGELAALLDRPHTADVRTLEESTFHVADAAELFQSDPVTTLHIATVMARRLDAANDALIKLRKGLVDKGVVLDDLGEVLDDLADQITFSSDWEPSTSNAQYRL